MNNILYNIILKGRLKYDSETHHGINITNNKSVNYVDNLISSSKKLSTID